MWTIYTILERINAENEFDFVLCKVGQNVSWDLPDIYTKFQIVILKYVEIRAENDGGEPCWT